MPKAQFKMKELRHENSGQQGNISHLKHLKTEIVILNKLKY